jgi:hypothetical protein
MTQRLALIQRATDLLRKDLDDLDFYELTGFVESLCRQTDKSVSLVSVPQLMNPS